LLNSDVVVFVVIVFKKFGEAVGMACIICVLPVFELCSKCRMCRGQPVGFSDLELHSSCGVHGGFARVLWGNEGYVVAHL